MKEDKKFTYMHEINDELAECYPEWKERVLNDLKFGLIDKLITEISKSEKIVRISDPVITKHIERGTTEMRLNMKITELIRCENCIYSGDALLCDGIKSYFCNLHWYAINQDDFCSCAIEKEKYNERG